LCHYQFKNGQPNYAATDSEITSQNSVVDDSEINSDGGVIPTYFFFFGVYSDNPNFWLSCHQGLVIFFLKDRLVFFFF